VEKACFNETPTETDAILNI